MNRWTSGRERERVYYVICTRVRAKHKSECSEPYQITMNYTCGMDKLCSMDSPAIETFSKYSAFIPKREFRMCFCKETLL